MSTTQVRGISESGQLEINDDLTRYQKENNIENDIDSRMPMTEQRM